MNALPANIWPPTRSIRASLLWSVGVGLTVPVAVASILKGLGYEDAAALVFLPGWIVILRATGGFFSGLGLVGNVVFLGTTAFAYSAVLFCAIRLWVCAIRLRATCKQIAGRTGA